jgi:hypothetical protein
MSAPLIPPPPPTVPLGRVVGPNVYIDQAWALYLTKGLFDRVGGYEAPSNTDIKQELHDLALQADPGIEELKADAYRLQGEVMLWPPIVPPAQETAVDGLVQALIAEVAELRKEIDSLKAGTIL